MKFDWLALADDMDAYAAKRGLSKRAFGRELGIAAQTLERVREGKGVSVENLTYILRALGKRFERYVEVDR